MCHVWYSFFFACDLDTRHIYFFHQQTTIIIVATATHQVGIVLQCSNNTHYNITLQVCVLWSLETISKACNQCSRYTICIIYTWYIFLPIHCTHIVYAVFYEDIIYDGDDTLENHRVPPPAGSNNNYYTGAHIIIIMIIIRLFFSFLRQLFPFLISIRPEKKTKDPMARGPNAFARNF